MMTKNFEVSNDARSVPIGRLVRTWFILVALLYYANGGFPGAAAGSSSADFSRTHQIGLLVVCAITSVLIAKRFKAIFSASLTIKAIVALPFIAILSALWSNDPRQSIVSGVTLLCFTLFAVYLTETYTSDEQLDLVMLTGVIAVPASILVAIFVPSIGANSVGWNGIFSHKQECAAAVTLFLVTALHWTPNTHLQRLFKPVYVMLCVFLIAMSQSRTGWLLALIGVVLSASLWILQRTPEKDSLFLLFTTVPLIGGIAYLFSAYSTDILTSVGKDPTLSERTIIWGAVWNEVMHRPLLGYGYEAFWQGLAGASKDVVLISGWNISQAQSGYLDLMIQFGLVGISLLLFMIGQAFVNSLRSFRRGPDKPFIRWCIVVICCNLVYNIGESDFGYLRILWLLFVMSCIGLAHQAALTKTFSQETGESLSVSSVRRARSGRPSAVSSERLVKSGPCL